MNEPISWDPSLVKKYSSSNHHKLINQLRNEVKKYPLNNKKKTSSVQTASVQIKNSNIDNKNVSIASQTQNSSLSNNSINNEAHSHKLTVSFNNAKNFSIYNQTSNNNSLQNDSLLTDQSKNIEDSSSPTFKDRLNQIDMK